ncbi:hypothetical protein [Fodinicola feengrottensis]|uniref:hypothetical protein n=1 Tax=Fodinicola feengrottensis TaxID=435914 RepID=UPI002442FECC|nr:hypothetical protein [Fodinicola feengrottensis]
MTNVIGKNTDRLSWAQELYERAIFNNDTEALAISDIELDRVEADLALARGRVIHVRFLADRTNEDPRELELFERAADLYHQLGDGRAEGEALFWVGIVHQVVRATTWPRCRSTSARMGWPSRLAIG